MKFGLVTDIHEHVEFLRIALDRFRQEQVDQIVVIGDIFETGEQVEETCQMLAEAKAVGVWGTHDYGLCVDPPDDIRARFPATVCMKSGPLIRWGQVSSRSNCAKKARAH